MKAKKRWWEQPLRRTAERHKGPPGSPSSGGLPKGRRKMLQKPQGQSGPVKRTWVDPDSM